MWYHFVFLNVAGETLVVISILTVAVTVTSFMFYVHNVNGTNLNVVI